MDKQIVILGAGVIGLTTALVLKRKGYSHVTIIAKHIPGDMSIEYTSPYAGAHWRSMAPADNLLLQKFDAVSYTKFMKIAGPKLENKEAGVMVIDAFDFFEDDTLIQARDPWYKDTVQNFKWVEKSEFPNDAKVGHQYTTVVINSPVYLKWLLDQFKSLGGILLKFPLTHIHQVTDLVKDVDNITVINCTGLGSKYLGGVLDLTLYPTRGQTVIVNAPQVKRTITYIHKQGLTYIIPRSDGTVVLGGTNEKGNENPHVDEATAQSIIEKTLILCPELGNKKDLDIIGHCVGLRPSRTDGPRLDHQVEKVHNKTLYITHAYGHGGYGFQSSWGSAELTVEIMEKNSVRL